MNFLAKIIDNFKRSDIEITDKMRVKELQKKFNGNFGLHLRIYEVGTGFASPEKYLSNINNVSTTEKFTIKATHTAIQVEESFKNNFNLKVRVAYKKDPEGKKTFLLDGSETLGNASRNNTK